MASKPSFDTKPHLIFHPDEKVQEGEKMWAQSYALGYVVAICAAGVASELTIYGLALYVPDALLLWVVVAIFTAVSYGWILWRVMVKIRAGNHLLDSDRAVWVPPGITRDFYHEQSMRIESLTNLSETVRQELRAKLFMSLIEIVRLERRMVCAERNEVQPGSIQVPLSDLVSMCEDVRSEIQRRIDEHDPHV